MKKTKVILRTLLILLVGGISFWWEYRPAPVPIRLALTGASGLKVAGTVTVDGVTGKFERTLPAEINVIAKDFAYTIHMTEPHGELKGELTAEDAHLDCSTAQDYAGITGSYSQRWFRNAGTMTMVNKDGQSLKIVLPTLGEIARHWWRGEK